MSEQNNDLPKNRTGSLLNMAAKVAFKQSKNLVQWAADERLKNMVSQADIVVQHVGRLKGAAMKAVQMLSIEGKDFFPPEVLAVLEKLQSQAPPLNDEQMHNLIRSELGEEKFSQLENLSAEPIAAASIGQVYTATYKGDSVVVKVQYPGIAESVDSDLSVLKALVKGLLLINGKTINIDDVFAEVTRILKLETDHSHERDCLLSYQYNLQKHPDYIVPRVYPELTTSKVIVMSNEQGMEFTEWVYTKPTLAAREKIATLLMDLYHIEFFHHRFVQTDPNPANFLVSPDNKLVLLDFGATVRYEEEFVKQYRELLTSMFSNDESVLEKLIELEFIDPRESDETKDEFVNFLQVSLKPFEAHRQPFAFDNNDYVDEVRTKALSFSRKIKYTAPPKKIIFLHRKLGGIFHLLRTLKVEMDLTRFLQFIRGEKVDF